MRFPAAVVLSCLLYLNSGLVFGQNKEIAGNWDSNWGPVTITQSPGDGSISGSWQQRAGLGTIKRGTFDPNTKQVKLFFYQPWNGENGSASLSMSEDGRTMTGTWQHGFGNGNWIMTRVSPEADNGNLIINGSFEDGPDPGSSATYAAGSTAIPGWTVTRGTIDYVGSIMPASDGKRSIDLDGTPGFGGISQTFPTTPGKEYIVRFDLAGNPAGPPATKTLKVEAAGQSEVFTHASTLEWSHETWRFTAREGTTRIEFYSLDTEGGYCGPLLDNVSVAVRELF
jgi:choice-of-anchor C domain-containing protein